LKELSPESAVHLTLATFIIGKRAARARPHCGGFSMNNIIYIVGLIVVVLAILSFLGLR
jgi:hypothetical protein